MGLISDFLETHFTHFNARETLAAAREWKKLIDNNGKMVLAMAGAMSTAEIGKSLSKLIREKKVHAISCTAANLEEDIFNLLAHDEYLSVPDYRHQSANTEIMLRDQGLNRVTDTCIPESVIDILEDAILPLWRTASEEGKGYFPYEYLYQLIDQEFFEGRSQIPKECSWILAAREMNLPIFTPGFEDSTLGNIFTAHVIKGNIRSHAVVKPGTEQFERLIHWYQVQNPESPVGFFQIGGGIAGDFAICCVPAIIQDLKQQANYWSYFAQISDSVTSYGSYSGAPPNEKITWHKLSAETPSFIINSDATIVFPLIAAYVLDE